HLAGALRRRGEREVPGRLHHVEAIPPDDSPTHPVTDPPRGDLTTRTDVHDLVTTFYREIVFDDLLAPVFGEVAEVQWAEHIPKLIDYWCWILFGTSGYRGAVTKTHRHLHSLEPLRPEH